ncbi:hypothetical protein SEVIR_9G198800v4 [Setaria viridis]|uniref:Uncharacterized protein n=1 Tax=Setaria viridis TaxID=4556 RepID=A0A4U6SVN2_SETVI|nr:hypothetical protein SEVIR_9G198800v2 [Setaria viridis]
MREIEEGTRGVEDGMDLVLTGASWHACSFIDEFIGMSPSTPSIASCVASTAIAWPHPVKQHPPALFVLLVCPAIFPGNGATGDWRYPTICPELHLHLLLQSFKREHP